MTIKTLEERLVYENAYVRVYDDAVEFPSGARGTYYRSRWTAPHGVAIVPVLGERVLLLRNFRYSERSWSVEVPQGFGAAGASPAEDAARELQEETGLVARRLTPLLSIGKDFVTHVFAAEIDPDARPHVAGAEASESIGEFLYVEQSQIGLAEIARLEVFDAVTIGALLAYRSTLS